METNAPQSEPREGAAASFRRRRTAFSSFWNGLTPYVRGAVFVSMGAITLTVMAIFVKQLGRAGMSPLQIQFFRAIIGLAVVLPLFRHDLWEPFRTKRPGLHMVRGFLGASANACLFWGITHLLLADAMALQFARPLWTIPVAMIFLKEFAGMRRTVIAFIGFAGILIYAKPFTAGFDPNALIAAMGALFGALVIISIKKLAQTEATRTIVFYFAFWGVIFAAVPAWFVWTPPTAHEYVLLLIVGVLGIGGQFMLTHGFAKGDATALVPLDYARIAYGAFLGWLLFGEMPGLTSWIGIALIVGTSIYLVLTERRRAR
ncbi:MAG: DMT family transporter [Hyphomicrobiales bacterium]|nr:DMT family transporter [Hyphomicrobiales bacterium]